VVQFLEFSRSIRERGFENCLFAFLALLRDLESRSDWQLKQARHAIEIYYYQFRGNTRDSDRPGETDGTLGFAERMRREMRLRHLSLKTESTYLGWVERFLGYCREVGAETAPPDSSRVREYLTHLAMERRVSSSTQNQAFNALLFLFREVLGVELRGLDTTPRARQGRKLPVVLSPEEVRRLLEATDADHRLVVELIYGCGLRLQELCRLRVKDVDLMTGALFPGRSRIGRCAGSLRGASLPVCRGSAGATAYRHDATDDDGHPISRTSQEPGGP
jgi:integrase